MWIGIICDDVCQIITFHKTIRPCFEKQYFTRELWLFKYEYNIHSYGNIFASIRSSLKLTVSWMMNGGSWCNMYKSQTHFEIGKVICMSDYTNLLLVKVKSHNRNQLTIRWTARPKLQIDYICIVIDTVTFHAVCCSRKSDWQVQRTVIPSLKPSIKSCINARSVIPHKMLVDIFMSYVTLYNSLMSCCPDLPESLQDSWHY